MSTTTKTATRPQPDDDDEHAALHAIDRIHEILPKVSGNLAVLERLFELMQANESDENNNTVDFGGTREQEFWYGLYQLAKDAGAVMGDLEFEANTLYDAAASKTGGAR